MLVMILIKSVAIYLSLTVIWIGWVFALWNYKETPLVFDIVTYLLFWNPEFIIPNGHLSFERLFLVSLQNSIIWGLIYFIYKIKISPRH
jgi:hypothetical protein